MYLGSTIEGLNIVENEGTCGKKGSDKVKRVRYGGEQGPSKKPGSC
jgi:hypothetical protein